MTILETRPDVSADDPVVLPTDTQVPRTVATPAPPHSLRRLGGWSREDWMTVLGAGISAICTTKLLFGVLTPLSGAFGSVVVAFVLFNVIYAFLVSLVDDRPAVVDRVMSVLMASAMAITVGSLASVVIDTLLKGREVLFKSNFYTQDMSATGPLDPLTSGGIAHAIVGSALIISLCLFITVPLGLACAIFLNETNSRLTGLVRTVVDAMTALPSIVAGLFIFATFILIFGFERSGLAAALAVSIMMLPIIVRSADVVLRLVPGNLREASSALGAPQWRTVGFVVLPTARSGLVTSVILGIARGIGETAPVLLTAGVTGTMNYKLTSGPMMSLPLAAFEFVRSPQPALVARGFATAAVLMLLVLALFVIARVLGGRPAGHLSPRQARRAAARSARDLERFEAREREAAAATDVAGAWS
jgi:phosphate transport system permease protein